VETWGLVFSGSSAVAPLLLGTVLGAIASGRLRVTPQGMPVSAPGAWIGPFPAAVGLLAAALFAEAGFTAAERAIEGRYGFAPVTSDSVTLGAITGGLDFSNYYLPLSTKVEPGLAYADAKKQGAVLGWGQFLTVALNFLIIAAVLFLAIKGMNKLKKEEPPAPASEPTMEVKLLTEIRDLLKKK